MKRFLITGMIVVITLIFPVLPRTSASQGTQTTADQNSSTSVPSSASGVHGVVLAHGVSPHNAQAALSGSASSAGNLIYHGGSVMHTNQTYAIYWIPAGYTMASGYSTLINRYLSDVAADSGRSSNVYATDTEYYDTQGGIAYQSHFDGSVTVTDPLPPNGCAVYSSLVSSCLSQDQIAAEVQKVVAAQGWTPSPTTVFFLLTAKGIGSCFGPGACAFTYYCAYHSGAYTSSGAVAYYANMPYADTSPNTCDSHQYPNGNDADATLTLLSHEHNETITDPNGDAWTDSIGNEDGDKCAWIFGTPLGGAQGTQYNQVINGHDYWTQMEWSNRVSGCLATEPSSGPTSTPIPVTGTSTPIVASPTQTSAPTTSTPVTVPPTQTPPPATNTAVPPTATATPSASGFTISPNSGPPGTNFTITFPANVRGSTALATWDGVPIFLQIVTAYPVVMHCQVPANAAAGSHAILAEIYGGTEQGSLAFTVTGNNPDPTATPTQFSATATPGQPSATPTQPAATATSFPTNTAVPNQPTPSPTPSSGGLTISNLSLIPMSNAFIVQWSTNLAATGEILYGTSPTSLGVTINNSGLSTYHYMLTPGLTAGTTYYYEARSTANGITVTSPIYSYHT